MARPVCTPKKVAIEASACVSSSATIPFKRLLGSASPESGSAHVFSPRLAKPGMSWNGNASRAQ